jgi:arginine exporter protein ArgO
VPDVLRHAVFILSTVLATVAWWISLALGATRLADVLF